jgi:Delta carbonic anhydrase
MKLSTPSTLFFMMITAQCQVSVADNVLRRVAGMDGEETCEANLATCLDDLADCDGPTANGSDTTSSFFRKASPFYTSENPCDGATPTDDYFNNVPCMVDGVLNTLEQAGANVTVGYKGEINATDRMPIMTTYNEAGLCPVNVHWHLGAEHYSAGEYDEFGTSIDAETDASDQGDARRRRNKVTGDTQEGYLCNLYDKEDPKFNTEYDWKYCVDMFVGETYEVHWPHSAAGAVSKTGNGWVHLSMEVRMSNLALELLLILNSMKCGSTHQYQVSVVVMSAYAYHIMFQQCTNDT